MSTVTNAAGNKVDFAAAVELMDDAVREAVHAEVAPCTDQEFFNAYCAAHLGEFGEAFAPDMERGQW